MTKNPPGTGLVAPEIEAPGIEPPIPLWALDQLAELLGRDLDGWEAKAPKWRSPSPDALVDDAVFDVPAVVKVIKALRRMPHTKGRQWARTPFEPETWQIVWLIAPVFGWKHGADGTRIVREVWDEIPRKNGKSTIAARLGLVLAAADGEWGGEVYAAATSKEQAKVVLGQAREVVLRSPDLRRGAEPLTDVIRFPATGSIFRALSRMADAAHGLNVSAGIVDEVHLHKSRGLIVAIETGTGAREQPLIIFITTAGDDDDTTIYAEKHTYAVKIADGKVEDPTVWVVIWAADESDDYLDEATWAKANPNYPTSPTPAFLRKEFGQLSEKPQKLGELLRLHLNIRHGIAEGIWTGAEAWNNHPGLVVEEKLVGQEAWGGLVGAHATQLAALCWVFANPEGSDGYWALWRYFLPRSRIVELNRRTGDKADQWVKEGRLIPTEHESVDFTAIIDRVEADMGAFAVQELSMDSRNAVGFVNELEHRNVDVEWGLVHSTSPGSSLEHWEGLLRDGGFNHGGNPISTWQVAHTKQRVTENAVRIDRKGSIENVNGIVAGELALRRALLARDPVESAYADYDEDDEIVVMV